MLFHQWGLLWLGTAAFTSISNVSRGEEYITTLLEADEYDSRTFFKTTKKKRSSKSTNTQLLHYKDGVLKGPEEVADGFASHFVVLATPSEDVKFDDSYRDQVMLDKLLIKDICRGQKPHFYPNYYRGKFQDSTDIKTNKAQDMQGLAAEHLKFAPSVVHLSLSNLMNYSIQTGYIPRQMKQGVITPVLKKDKDPLLPTNYTERNNSCVNHRLGPEEGSAVSL